MSQHSEAELEILLDIATEAVMSAGAILENYWGEKSITTKRKDGLEISLR